MKTEKGEGWSSDLLSVTVEELSYRPTTLRAIRYREEIGGSGRGSKRKGRSQASDWTWGALRSSQNQKRDREREGIGSIISNYYRSIDKIRTREIPRNYYSLYTKSK